MKKNITRNRRQTLGVDCPLALKRLILIKPCEDGVLAVRLRGVEHVDGASTIHGNLGGLLAGHDLHAKERRLLPRQPVHT